MNTMRYKSIGYSIITREHAHDRQRSLYIHVYGRITHIKKVLRITVYTSECGEKWIGNN